jgi:hypothetical protein
VRYGNYIYVRVEIDWRYQRPASFRHTWLHAFTEREAYALGEARMALLHPLAEGDVMLNDYVIDVDQRT